MFLRLSTKNEVDDEIDCTNISLIAFSKIEEIKTTNAEKKKRVKFRNSPAGNRLIFRNSTFIELWT